MDLNSLDLFNLLQITGIVLAILCSIGVEKSNRKLHLENQRRRREDALDWLDSTPIK